MYTSRFASEPEIPEKLVKTLDRNKVRPPSGPSSLNPGSWVTDAYLTGLEAITDTEEFLCVVAILESYRLGPRYLIGTAVRPADDAIGFAISEVVQDITELAAPQWPTDRDKELLNYKPVDDSEPGREADFRITPAPSQTLLNSHYARWTGDPSESNGKILWDALFAFCGRKANSARSSDKLWQQGAADDLLQDFMASMVRTLQTKREKAAQGQGTNILKFSSYINRSWRRRRISASQKLTKDNLYFPSSTFTDPVDNGMPVPVGDSVSLDDKRDYGQFMVDERDGFSIELDGEDLLKSRKAKLHLLDPGVRDYVGNKLLGMRDGKIATKLNLSRQAVGRLKAKAMKVAV